MSRTLKVGLLITTALLLLAACQSDPVSTPLPENTAAPTAPVVVPTNTLPPVGTSAPVAPGSIFGWVWHDECAVNSAGGTVQATAGCTQAGGAYHANGVKTIDEQPIGGVKVQLGAGACPSAGLLAMETITADVSYGFTNLKPGTYCVTIDPLSEPNPAKLLPGNWTYPALVDGAISTTVTLSSGENKYDVNFGWDYQFLPAVGEACTYRAAFLGDVTIPDNTITAPGAPFVKTWRLRNDSTCAWGPGLKLHSLYFINGNQLGAPAEVPLPSVVQPGGTIDVSINMTAPNQPGTYRSEWMLQVADAMLLGVGPDGQTPLYTQIVVQAGQPNYPPPCTYRATFLGDVTMPDNAVLSPGAPFVKTWRLRNDGTCAWGPNAPVYAVTNINGSSFGAPTVLSMPVAQPGSIIDLSINMAAPNAPGNYRSEWMFMVKEGGLRGVGLQGETPLYTQIVVQNPQPACVYRAAFLGDMSVPDNSPIAAGAPFIKIWRVRNDGNCAWGPGSALHSLVFLGGNQMNAPTQVEIPTVVQPGQAVELSVPLVAPNLAGTYRNEWKLKVDNGPLIGVGPSGQSPLYVQIVVPSNAPCTYRATFLGDVTIPDNTLISPGQPFRKTWRLRNDGTCAWGQNAVVSAMTNVNNQPLGAPMVIGMPSVPPGGVVDLSIDMIGPNQPGTYRSEWMFMVNEGGLRGVGAQGETPIYAQIVVPGLP
jgi:hypothetical protein